MKKVQKLANEIREYLASKSADSENEMHLNIIEIIDKHAPIEKPFPKVMSNIHRNGYLVLFEKDKKTGIVVDDDNTCGEWTKIGGKIIINRGTLLDFYKDCEIQVKP